MTITKFEAIAQVTKEIGLSNNAIAVMIEVVKKNFITAKEIREIIENSDSEMTAGQVNANIGVLIKNELIEKSGDGLMTTAKCDEIIAQAVEIWKADKPETPTKKRRQPRQITPEMTERLKFLEGIARKSYDIRDIVVNRQNYEILLNKAPNGYRKFEILNRGIFRIFGYKVPQDTLVNLAKIGCEYRVSGSSVYIDIECNEENITKVMNAL